MYHLTVIKTDDDTDVFIGKTNPSTNCLCCNNWSEELGCSVHSLDTRIMDIRTQILCTENQRENINQLVYWPERMEMNQKDFLCLQVAAKCKIEKYFQPIQQRPISITSTAVCSFITSCSATRLSCVSHTHTALSHFRVVLKYQVSE